MARLSLSFLGPFQVSLDGQPVTGFESNKVRALLAYLAVESDRPHARDVLAGMLWPHYLSRSATANLRSALANLRAALGDRESPQPFLIVSRDTIRFNPAADHVLDTAGFETIAGWPIHKVESLLATYRGDFLEGFSLLDSPPFEEWLLVKREHYRRRAMGALERLEQRYRSGGELDKAIHYARRQLELEAGDESTHRRLMWLLAASGHRDLALAQYEVCRHALRQALDIEPGQETVELYESIRAEVLLPGSEPPSAGTPPYKGLGFFDEADAKMFFGRESLTAQLVAEVSRLAGQNNGQARVLTIIGASGSGKSSIARAGLVPAMRALRVAGGDEERYPFRDAIIVLTPTASPLESLAQAMTYTIDSVQPVAALIDDMAAEQRSLHLAATRLAGRDGFNSPLLLVVDQFEELFTLCREAGARQAFIDNLIYAATAPGPVVVVLALRADFYEQCAPFSNLRQALTGRQIYIGVMGSDELRRAIEEPARRGGWLFEPGLVNLLLTEVGQAPGALPLLSHALLETWRRREGRFLTLAAYQASGGVAGALAQSAESVFNRFSPSEQLAVRNVFLRLVELSGASAGESPEFFTARRASLAELLSLPEGSNLVHGALNRLADARLITIGQDTVEVAHEALIREWPRLRGWLNENRAGLRLHHRLSEAAQEWERSDGDEGLLYRGARLAETREWAKSHADELTQLEHRYLEAGAAEETTRQQRELATARQLADMEQRRAAEEARAAAGLRKRAWFLAMALVVAAMTTIIAVSYARIARSNALLSAEHAAEARASAAQSATHEAEAIANAELATSRELSLAAINNLATDPDLSLLLALRALEYAETKEAQEALHQAIQSARTRLVIETGGTGVHGALLAVALDGRLLATAGESAAKIWDAATGAALRQLPLAVPGSGHHQLAFDERGESLTLVTAGPSREAVTVQRWSVADGRTTLLATLPAVHDESSDIAVSPDDTLLAVGQASGAVELWDIEGEERLFLLPGHSGVIADVAFNGDGRWLATAGTDGSIFLWDVAATLAAASPQPLAAWRSTRPQLETGDLVNIRFVAADTLVLGYIGQVEVWNLADPAHPLSRLLASAALSRDYAADASVTRLAVAGQDATATIWDLETGEQSLVLARHTAPMDSLAFSPLGNRVLTIDRGGQVRVWDARPQPLGEKLSLSVDPGVFDLQLSPDERQMALGNIGGPASVWDATTGERLLSLAGENGGVYRVAFSPDGRQVAGAGRDSTVRVWDSATGVELLAFPAHGAGVAGGLFQGVLDLAYSPDGTRLATAGADGLAKVWDAATGRELLALTGHTDSLHSLAYSPDGRMIATTSDEEDTTVKVWDARTGEEIYTLSGHLIRAWGVAFSPDSSLLITGGARGIINAWNMTTGRKVYTVIDITNHVGNVVFAPDGQTFITTGEVPLRVRRVTDGEELLTIAAPILWSAQITRDGRWLYAAGVDGMVRVYALQLDDAVALAADHLTRWWRPDECRRFLHTNECPPRPEDR